MVLVPQLAVDASPVRFLQLLVLRCARCAVLGPSTMQIILQAVFHVQLARMRQSWPVPFVLTVCLVIFQVKMPLPHVLFVQKECILAIRAFIAEPVGQADILLFMPLLLV